MCCNPTRADLPTMGTECFPQCDSNAFQICHDDGDCPARLSCVGASSSPGLRTCAAKSQDGSAR